MNEHQNTGPESSLEKLLDELEKCDWKENYGNTENDQENAEQGQMAPRQREVGRHFEKFKVEMREWQHFPPQACRPEDPRAADRVGKLLLLWSEILLDRKHEDNN